MNLGMGYIQGFKRGVQRTWYCTSRSATVQSSKEPLLFRTGGRKIRVLKLHYLQFSKHL